LREFGVKNVLSKFSHFIADAIRAMENETSLKELSRGCDFDLFEAKEVLAKDAPNGSFEHGKGLSKQPFVTIAQM
jgi:hypothetical protein